MGIDVESGMAGGKKADVRLRQRFPSWSGTDQKSCYEVMNQNDLVSYPPSVVPAEENGRTHSGPLEDMMTILLALNSAVENCW